jgi:hypothetical protein
VSCAMVRLTIERVCGLGRLAKKAEIEAKLRQK